MAREKEAKAKVEKEKRKVEGDLKETKDKLIETEGALNDTKELVSRSVYTLFYEQGRSKTGSFGTKGTCIRRVIYSNLPNLYIYKIPSHTELTHKHAPIIHRPR